MSERLAQLRQRVLLPIGLTALFVATAGHGWWRSDALFTGGFLVVLVTLVAMVAALTLEKRADVRERESDPVS